MRMGPDIACENVRDILGLVTMNLELAGQLRSHPLLQAWCPNQMAKCAVWTASPISTNMAAISVLQPPLFANDPLEIQPSRSTKMGRIAHQLGALEILRKQLFAKKAID